MARWAVAMSGVSLARIKRQACDSTSYPWDCDAHRIVEPWSKTGVLETWLVSLWPSLALGSLRVVQLQRL